MNDYNLRTKERSYFSGRNINPTFYLGYKIPTFLKKRLPPLKSIRILDIGPGFGQMLSGLRDLGYCNIFGIDISDESINFCRKNGFTVEKIYDLLEYSRRYVGEKYDFIIMSHVLEHIEKDKIIETLSSIRENLLKEDSGFLFLMVPNGQSNTGAYWMYEDFTHTTLFTTGSLSYVLSAAGYSNIVFVDPRGIENYNFFIKFFRLLFLPCFIFNRWFWNRVTGSSYHKRSQNIFTFEIKAMASYKK